MSLEQAREAIQSTIDLNPVIVLIYRNIMIDNGFGKLVPDPHHVDPEPVSVRGRIINERKAIEKVATSPIGLSTAITPYFLVNHRTTINQHESFEANGKRWRIGPVEKIIQYGGVSGYRSPLIEAGEATGADT